MQACVVSPGSRARGFPDHLALAVQVVAMQGGHAHVEEETMEGAEMMEEDCLH